MKFKINIRNNFQKKACPICNTSFHSKLIYPQNLSLKNIDFSARKNPDNFHYNMLRCLRCKVLYAKEIYKKNIINKLYEKSKFSYKKELNNLKKTYGQCLKEIISSLDNSNNFLDIGAGNGFMLEQAKTLGFKNVVGVEPSLNAYHTAKKNIKKNILNTTFRSTDFKKNYFDLVFSAMTIEHVINVNKFLKDIYKILKPGGKVVIICHDEGHIIAKILKDKHPIINDEHIVVFNKFSIEKILKKNHFKNVIIKNLKNFYSLEYYIFMLPISTGIKKKILKILNFFSLNKKVFGINVGNIYLSAIKKSE